MEAHGLNAEGVALLPPGHGWLLAELGGETSERGELHGRRSWWRRFLMGSAPAWSATLRPNASCGLCANQALGPRPSGLTAHHNYEGWEDGAVPPARLAEYLRGITALWAEHGYSGAWYGHFGQGCVHTRNNFDLRTSEGLRQYRSYVTRPRPTWWYRWEVLFRANMATVRAGASFSR